jgi:hypothetical protein
VSQSVPGGVHGLENPCYGKQVDSRGVGICEERCSESWSSRSSWARWCFRGGGDAAQRDSAPTSVPAYNVLADRTDGPVHYATSFAPIRSSTCTSPKSDLTDPRVRVRVCPGGGDPDGEEGYWNTSLQTVRAIAQRERLVVAVNGNFFQCKDTRSIAGRKIPYFVGQLGPGFGAGDERTDGCGRVTMKAKARSWWTRPAGCASGTFITMMRHCGMRSRWPAGLACW